MQDFCTLFAATLALSGLALSGGAHAAAEVQAAPVPQEMRSSFFAVTVNNQRVDVAQAASNYEFVSFDTTGPVRSSTGYIQDITGSTNTALVPNHGAATVTNLATGTASTGPAPLAPFKITTL